jgi:hypothetical protein
VTIIVEKRLRFEFGPSWQDARKYDEHEVYRAGLEGLKAKVACEACGSQFLCQRCGREADADSRAVDIVGRYRGQLYLIEVKDFREHEVENRARIGRGLAIEVARKVRDTLAGMVGAAHGRDGPSWKPLVEPLLQKQPHVLLWLEEDLRPERIEKRGHPAPDVAESLRICLRWLSQTVMVVNQQTVWPALDVKVHRIPSRVFNLREVIWRDRKKAPGSISRDDFCAAMRVPAQAAGAMLARLCEQGFLARVPGDADRYTAGALWDHFHEDPA